MFVAAAAAGGKKFVDPAPAEPATARSVLGFAATLAGFMITWATLSSDYTNYFDPRVSR